MFELGGHALENIGRSAHEFKEGVARGVGEFGQNIAGPALDHIGKRAYDFGQQIRRDKNNSKTADESDEQHVAAPVSNHIARDASTAMQNVSKSAGIMAGPARFAVIALRDARTAAALFKVLFAT